MARRDRISADRRGVAIGTLKNRLFLGDARFPFAHFLKDLRTVARTRIARQYRDVGIDQSFQIGVLRNSNMAGHTILDRMIFLLVVEF